MNPSKVTARLFSIASTEWNMRVQSIAVLDPSFKISHLEMFNFSICQNDLDTFRSTLDANIEDAYQDFSNEDNILPDTAIIVSDTPGGQTMDETARKILHRATKIPCATKFLGVWMIAYPEDDTIEQITKRWLLDNKTKYTSKAARRLATLENISDRVEQVYALLKDTRALYDRVVFQERDGINRNWLALTHIGNVTDALWYLRDACTRHPPEEVFEEMENYLVHATFLQEKLWTAVIDIVRKEKRVRWWTSICQWFKK
jgi:hypothetical protein